MREDLSKRPSEIAPLAQEIIVEPEKLSLILSFLNSRSAPSSSLLGRELGRLDKAGKFLDQILDSAVHTGSSAFAFGYAGELLARFPELAARYSAWLDHLESDAPTLAHYLALAAPESAKPLERSIRLISAQRLDVHLLEHFLPGIFLSRMTSAELCTVLDLLVSAGDPSSLHIATDFIGHCIQFERPFQRDERAAMWRVLDASAPIEDRAHYWWTAAVEQFSNENPEQAIRTAIRGLLGSDYDKRNSAWDVLSKVARSTWASTNANVLLEGIGELLLDKENSWRLSTGPKTGFFQIIPESAVRAWLRQHGVEGARALATYLPAPALDAEGNPQIHPLSEFLLAEWGQDSTVFNRFVASTRHLRLYSGDIAATHRREAESARRFLSHPVPAVRKWAEIEVAVAERQAHDWAVDMEEQGL